MGTLQKNEKWNLEVEVWGSQPSTCLSLVNSAKSIQGKLSPSYITKQYREEIRYLKKGQNKNMHTILQFKLFTLTRVLSKIVQLDLS